MKKQTSWEIVYTRYEGTGKRALEFLSREMGKFLIREEGEYILHVLPCTQESPALSLKENAVVLGVYRESALLRTYIKEDVMGENDYLLKLVANPENPEGLLVLLAAREEAYLYLAAAAFIDDYIYAHPSQHGYLFLANRFFDGDPIPKCTVPYRVGAKTRSIFAWGHAINDYRAFFYNMARQGLNQLILWNDHRPLNAADIVECAHSYGIELIWGFAWGWAAGGCREHLDFSPEALDALKKNVVAEYLRSWHGVGDGIYFQSFTEHDSDEIDGKSVAEVVTAFVNGVAEELYRVAPQLKIQFGLHATSVKNDLPALAKIDPRIEILWEDCGTFPYAYMPTPQTDEEFAKTVAFTKEILSLRGKDAKTGLVFKGFPTLDWTHGNFVNQRGPYILGENAPEISQHDRRLRDYAWRVNHTEWILHGGRAREMAEIILNEVGGDVNLCMAGAFDGAVFAASAICSEIFLDPYRPYDEIVSKVMRKKYCKVE